MSLSKDHYVVEMRREDEVENRQTLMFFLRNGKNRGKCRGGRDTLYHLIQG